MQGEKQACSQGFRLYQRSRSIACWTYKLIYNPETYPCLQELGAPSWPASFRTSGQNVGVDSRATDWVYWWNISWFDPYSYRTSVWVSLGQCGLKTFQPAVKQSCHNQHWLWPTLWFFTSLLCWAPVHLPLFSFLFSLKHPVTSVLIKADFSLRRTSFPIAITYYLLKSVLAILTNI